MCPKTTKYPINAVLFEEFLSLSGFDAASIEEDATEWKNDTGLSVLIKHNKYLTEKEVVLLLKQAELNLDELNSFLQRTQEDIAFKKIIDISLKTPYTLKK